MVSDQPGEALAALAQGQGISSRARRDWPKVSSSVGRFVVSLVVARAGIPDPLSTEAFIVPTERGRPDPRRPPVHLQKLAPPAESGDDAPERLLVAEVLLPLRGPLTILEARDAVLATLSEQLPFLERHLLVVDSPHDCAHHAGALDGEIADNQVLDDAVVCAVGAAVAEEGREKSCLFQISRKPQVS